MKLNKPRFWDSKKSLLAIFLFPLTLVTTLITYLRRITSKPISFKIPVICIGEYIHWGDW